MNTAHRFLLLALLLAATPVLLRGLAGTLPLMLWLAPFILVLMAASSWLKRLGVPVVLVGGAVTVGVLHEAYGIDAPLLALQGLNDRISHTLLHDGRGLVDALRNDSVNLWTWVMQDLGRTAAELASLQFLGWMAVAAAGFALVVAKRARGG